MLPPSEGRSARLIEGERQTSCQSHRLLASPAPASHSSSRIHTSDTRAPRLRVAVRVHEAGRLRAACGEGRKIGGGQSQGLRQIGGARGRGAGRRERTTHCFASASTSGRHPSQFARSECGTAFCHSPRRAPGPQCRRRHSRKEGPSARGSPGPRAHTQCRCRTRTRRAGHARGSGNAPQSPATKCLRSACC
jgi:hypothetical protein